MAKNLLKFFSIKLYTLLFLILSGGLNAQFEVDTSLTDVEYINNLVGLGVSYNNVQFQGDGQAIGFFTGASNNLGFDSGIILSTGFAADADQPSGNFAGGFLPNGLTDIPELAANVPNCGGATNDGLILQFDFVPQSSPVSFRYIFASEEYPDYVCSDFNDAFVFMISGPGIVGEQNLAFVPGSGDPITINTINSGVVGANGSPFNDPCILNNSTFYNAAAPNDIVYNGYTNVMTAVSDVTPCETYTLRLIIADGCDPGFDSAVFLEANSFGAAPIAITQTTLNGDSMTYEGCAPATLIFSRQNPDPFDYVFPFTLSGTAINGVDYEPVPPSITIPAGETSVSLEIIGIADGIVEGEETIELTYETICGTISTLIYLTEPPQITVIPDPAPSICGGQGPVIISGEGATGVEPYTYSWSDNLGTTNTASVNPLATTTYVLTVTDFCGAEATADITVPVGTTPEVPVIDLPVDPICEEETINLSASTTTAGADLVWSGPNGFTANAVNAIQITDATVANDGIYEVYATLTGCDSEPATVSVIVKPRPSIPVIITNSPVCEGNALNLAADVIPANAVINWTGPNGFTATGVAATIASTQLTSAGIYAATATLNGCDANAAGSAQVVVNETPEAPSASANSPVCAGFDLNLSTPVVADSYQWLGPLGYNSAAQNPIQGAITSGNAGNYTVSITINGCPSPLTTVNVEVIDADFLPPIVSNSPVCEGSNLTFTTPEVNGGQYFWSGPISFQSNEIENEIEITSEANEGDYSLYIVVGACTTATNTSLLTINPIPVADAGLDIQICSLEDGQIGAPAVPNYSYSWFPSDSLNSDAISNPTVNVGNIGGSTDILEYRLTVESGGCFNEDTVLVEVLPQPVASFVAPNPQCFEGNSFDFEADGIWESLDPRFVWDFGPWASPDSSALQNPDSIRFSTTGLQMVRLVVIDQGCQSNPFIAPVNVKKMPVSNYIASELVVCEPHVVDFINFSENSGDPMSFQWSFGNGKSSEEDSPSILYSNPGVYDVDLVVNGINGCVSNYTIPNMITVNQSPDAGFNASPLITNIVFPDVTFEDLSNHSDSCWYEMGNGDTIAAFDHVYTYSDTGSYQVAQILANEQGCRDTAYADIRVDIGIKVYIPSSFSPNDDGLNDYFKVYGEDFYDFSMVIYNRWGQQLYRSFDPENGWDGNTKLSDKPVPSGVYIYTVELKDRYGLPYTYNGNVTVLK